MTTATVNGVQFAFDLTGPEDAPLVVFSNSLGANTAMWDDVVPIVAGRYRCLTYDTRGHGRSGSSDAVVTVDDLASDLTGLMDHIGVRQAHIAGLSLGGMTAQALASRRPERMRSEILMATTAHLPPEKFWRDRAETVRQRGPEVVVDALIPRWFTPEFIAARPDIIDKMRRALLSIDRVGYGRCCEAIGSMDLRDRLGSITMPTLVIAGALDPVTTPAMAEVIHAGIPGSELVVLPNALHMLAVEQPGAVARLILRFIDSVEGKSPQHG